MRPFLLLLVLAAPLAQAETYKWVDERGVVNYSNTPPPAGSKLAAAAQPVEDRISVIPREPTFDRTMEIYRRLDLQEAEWLQRQRLMAAATPPAPPRCASADCDYRVPTYAAPFFPVVVTRTPGFIRTVTPRAAPRREVARGRPLF